MKSKLIFKDYFDYFIDVMYIWVENYFVNEYNILRLESISSTLFIIYVIDLFLKIVLFSVIKNVLFKS